MGVGFSGLDTCIHKDSLQRGQYLYLLWALMYMELLQDLCIQTNPRSSTRV